MLKQTLNKGISTPIAIATVLMLVIIVGTFTWWQYGKMWKESNELPEIELPEKEFCGGSLDSCDGKKMILDGEIAKFTVWQHFGGTRLLSDIEDYEEYEYSEYFDLDREYMQIILRSKEKIDCENKLKVQGILDVVRIECDPPEIVGKCPGTDYQLFVSGWECLDETADLVLFEKNEGWGPCPPSITCNQSTKLYYSGELILEGKENIRKKIDRETIERIKDKIRSTGIMDKDCWTETPVPDYSATYIFNLEGEIKKMRYPNCEEELKEVEELIEEQEEVKSEEEQLGEQLKEAQELLEKLRKELEERQGEE